MEIWQHGIMHSGPRMKVQLSSYDEFHDNDSAKYWEKSTDVSQQNPPNNGISCTFNMMSEIFIASGAAVAFPGKGTTQCLESWLTYVLDYPKYIIKATADIWGSQDKYNHHF